MRTGQLLQSWSTSSSVSLQTCHEALVLIPEKEWKATKLVLRHRPAPPTTPLILTHTLKEPGAYKESFSGMLPGTEDVRPQRQVTLLTSAPLGVVLD